MLLMERLLAESDLDWTVVRPSGLFDAGRVSDFRLQEDHSDGIFTSRADLADCLVARAIDGEWCGKRVAVSTSEGAPTLWQMIRREAFVPFRSRSPRAAARPWRGPGRAPG